MLGEQANEAGCISNATNEWGTSDIEYRTWQVLVKIDIGAKRMISGQNLEAMRSSMMFVEQAAYALIDVPIQAARACAGRFLAVERDFLLG